MDQAPPEMLTLPGGQALVSWRRSARATRVSLRIDPGLGAVVVTLPPRASRGAGMALLIDHAGWVSDRLAALPEALPFVAGAEVPIGGVPHRICHRPRGRGGAWIEGSEIHVAGDAAFLSRRVHDLLRALARKRLGALALDKAALIEAPVTRLTVRDTTSRWGSCASGGGLSFSWRLVMAPDHVQDYVAAHEVSHLRHMNHGRRFWTLVDRLSPHTESAKTWLHENGARLLRVG
jgi:predicted metal-dependent hydrolase